MGCRVDEISWNSYGKPAKMMQNGMKWGYVTGYIHGIFENCVVPYLWYTGYNWDLTTSHPEISEYNQQ